MINNLAFEYLLEGRYQKATPMFGKASEILRQNGDMYQAANSRANHWECRFNTEVMEKVVCAETELREISNILGMEAVFDGETMEDNWSNNAIPGGPGTPAIEFTYVPPYESFDDLKGQAWHVNPEDYAIAVYICVSGWWWTKPTFAQPLTTIRADGSWICDVTTGGIDETATKIAAFLLPNWYDPPLLSGEASLPVELDQTAVAKTETARTP